MGKYDIKIQGVPMKVHVIDSKEEAFAMLAEYTPVVGVGFKPAASITHPDLLILCVDAYCFVVQCKNNFSEKNFLAAEEICFLGVEKIRYLSFSGNTTKVKTGVTVDDLAARPSADAEKIINRKATVFADEEVKIAVYDAYMCFKVGHKLPSFLDD
ncbi:hypothetical protein Ancab_000578 [Ancistrocladus abbreviatus]